MPYKLVTVATFSTPSEASIIRCQLDAEGIRTFVADDEAVVTLWHLGIALGGVKVQVAEEDADRAITILKANEPATITKDDWQSDEIDEKPESDAEDEISDNDYPTVSSTDEMVARAQRAAIIGLWFFPLQLYSIWLLMRIGVEDTKLSPQNQRRIFWTLICILILPVVFFFVILLWIVTSY